MLITCTEALFTALHTSGKFAAAAASMTCNHWQLCTLSGVYTYLVHLDSPPVCVIGVHFHQLPVGVGYPVGVASWCAATD